MRKLFGYASCDRHDSNPIVCFIHQQNNKKLSAFLGHFGSFPVVEKLTSHTKSMNSCSNTSSDTLNQMYHYNLFYNFKINSYYEVGKKNSVKTESELPNVVVVVNNDRQK
jgi:hypothetical protein